MNKNQFNKIYRYLGQDKYAYIVVKRSNCVELTENKKLLIQEIEKLEQNHDFLRININLRSSGYFSFQQVVDTKKSNAYLIRLDILQTIAKNIGLNIDRLFYEKDVLIKQIQDVHLQEKRKTETLKKRSENKEWKEIKFANNRTSKSLVKWANNNKKKLEESSTKYEKKLYSALYKPLKGRVKKQQPFIINKHLYYADIYIPSLKLVIEVDGGYHNTEEQKEKDKQRDEDFKSIGYTTLRYTNEQIDSKKGKQEIVKTILDYKLKKH